MTHISKAALPPIQPPISAADRQHPLFPVYQQYRSSMSNLLVEASAFRDWLYQYEREQRETVFTQHPRFKEFQRWMVAAQGGRRPCCPTKDNPGGVMFPANFQYWLNGGRW